jgi:hypothetical protein
MPLNITRHLNKTVFVSIPSLFADGVCRPYQLLGVELNGLWLQSEELTRRLLPREVGDHATLAPAVFVPLAQIAGVLVVGPRASAPAAEAAGLAEPRREKSDSRPPRKSK